MFVEAGENIWVRQPHGNYEHGRQGLPEAVARDKVFPFNDNVALEIRSNAQV